MAGADRGVALARFRPNGGLDTSFGSGGVVTTSLSGGTSRGYAIAIQPDDRIVVVGRAGGALLLAGYEPDDDLDPKYGGLVTLRLIRLIRDTPRKIGGAECPWNSGTVALMTNEEDSARAASRPSLIP